MEWIGSQMLIYYQHAYSQDPYRDVFMRSEQLYTDDVIDENVMSIWMAFGGNTRDLGSIGEETDKTTTLHQLS
nr:hypothetical protein [Tanacetum cinerariifolium]